METQHKFEAPTLAEVLAKVQTQLGPGAKIINAQRVRSGGMLGFFQSEHFEVVATVPPPEEPPAPHATSEQPTSLLSLAESVNAVEGGYEIPGATVSPTLRIPLAPSNESTTVTSAIQNAESDNPFAAIMAHVQAETAPDSRDRSPLPADTTVVSLDDSEDDEEPVDEALAEVMPTGTTEEETTDIADLIATDDDADNDADNDAEGEFNDTLKPEILDLSATERDPDALTDEELDAYFAIEPLTIDPLTETFAPPREYQPHSDLDLDALFNLAPIQDDPIPWTPPLENRTPTDLDLDALFNLAPIQDDPIPWTPPVEYRSHTDRDLDALFNLAPEHEEPLERYFTPPQEYRAHTDLDLDALFNLAPIQDDPIPWTPPEEAPLPGPVILDTLTVLPPSRKQRWSDYLHLGLPLHYLPTRDESLEAAFVRQLPALPEVTPGAGSVICVAGERQAATAFAHVLSAQHRAEIALATAKVARTPRMQIIRKSEDAINLRHTWRRRQQPTIVVLVDEPTPESHQWSRDILVALEPVLTYGVVDASRKTEDLSAWSHALGGIDALAVDGLDGTLTPAAILSNEIPVASIDGTPATASAWAEYLLQRTQRATAPVSTTRKRRTPSTSTSDPAPTDTSHVKTSRKKSTGSESASASHQRRRKAPKSAIKTSRSSKARASHA